MGKRVVGVMTKLTQQFVSALIFLEAKHNTLNRNDTRKVRRLHARGRVCLRTSFEVEMMKSWL